MTEELNEIRKRLKKVLKKERYEHTIGVMYTSAALAMRYGEDIQDALTAGLLHDCAKCYTVKEQIKLCRKYDIELTDSELSSPALIHAKLGAYLAQHEYGVESSKVVEAIRWHTTGKPEMSLAEKILYIADYIEPNRKEIPLLSAVRGAAFTDIDKAVAISAGGTLEHLKSLGAGADPMTEDTYQYYKEEGISHE